MVELLVVIAIIGLLAGTIYVGIGAYRKKARETRVLGELSSAIASMKTCWMNSGDVKRPCAAWSGTDCTDLTGGNDICSLASSYGKWPKTGEAAGFGSSEYASSGTGEDLDKSSWFVQTTLDDDEARVCCNSSLDNCVILADSSENCDEDSPPN